MEQDINLEKNAILVLKEKNNTLVSAGPGSGKTELLAQKAKFLFESNKCRYPQKILAISFKKDSAINLKERILKRRCEQYNNRFISVTYDSFFKSILDRFYRALPKEYSLNPNYEILTGKEGNDIIRGHLIDVGYNELSQVINEWQSNNEAEQLVKKSNLPIDDDNMIKKFWQTMMSGDNEHKAYLNFDMIAKIVSFILETNPNIVNIIRSTYGYVFLDEFQDTTGIQYKIIKKLFQNSNSKITAVGDNKQRIMGWAGALQDIFEIYKHDFQATSYPLLMNHRSAPRLVKLQSDMNAILQTDNLDIKYEDKWNENDGIINLINSDDELIEAQIICKLIKKEISEGISLNDICIVCKQKPSDYTRSIISQLHENNIDARIEDKYQEIIKEDIVKFILNILNLSIGLNNPDSWEYVKDFSFKINGMDNLNHKQYSLAASKLKKIIMTTKQRINTVHTQEEFNDLINSILTVYDVNKIIAQFPQYRNEKYKTNVLDNFYRLMWREINKSNLNFKDAINNFCGENSIPIMTIHKSKGLEYNSVYFIGLEDSAFWNFRNQPEEDRCSFFVALSRARKKISFTYCKYRNSLKFPRQNKKYINEFHTLLQKNGRANIITSVNDIL